MKITIAVKKITPEGYASEYKQLRDYVTVKSTIYIEGTEKIHLFKSG